MPSGNTGSLVTKQILPYTLLLLVCSTWLLIKMVADRSVTLQAKYDDIKKVVKAASEGAMKGILGYTEDQVGTCR